MIRRVVLACAYRRRLPPRHPLMSLTHRQFSEALNQDARASAEPSFYRRPLPTDTCVAFGSVEGKQLFKRALSTPYANIYFQLAPVFQTQAEPAFCGLGTLSMILNGLEVDPGRQFKGVWRWYHEQLLDCCMSLEKVAKEGISLHDFSCLAACNSLRAETYYAPSEGAAMPPQPARTVGTVDEFREHVKQSCASDDTVIAVNYSRAVVKQTGDGHFSPIGAYDAESDRVLVLDTARFKYAPHWLALPLLYEAMHTYTDSARGYSVLRRAQASRSLFRVRNRTIDDVDALVRHLQADVATLDEAVASLRALPLSEVAEPVCRGAAGTPRPHNAQFADEVMQSAMFRHVFGDTVRSDHFDLVDHGLLVVLLYVLAERLPALTKNTVEDQLPPMVAAEVRYWASTFTACTSACAECNCLRAAV